jgi:WD40 repeat protein
MPLYSVKNTCFMIWKPTCLPFLVYLALIIVCPLNINAESPVIKPRLVIQTGHTDSINSIVFSADSSLLASGSSDSTAKLWQAETGRELATFGGFTKEVPVSVESVAFSPDGRKPASGSNDNTIKVWSVANGKELKTLKGHTQIVYSLAFDRNAIVSGSADGTLRFWDSESGDEICRTLRRRGIKRSVLGCYEVLFLIPSQP